MYKLSDENDRAIRFLLDQGLSIREIGRRTGYARATIMRRNGRRDFEAPSTDAKLYQCDFCGSDVHHREFHRRTRRTKHKFCTHGCYGAFYRYWRRNERCARCNMRRRDGRWGCGGLDWVRGMCGRCYGIMYRFGFDAEMADTYELTQDLKKEISDARNQKHGRSTEDVA